MIVTSMKCATATLAAVVALLVGCSSEPVSPAKTIIPSVEITKTPKVKTACDIKFDELIEIEEAGIRASDPSTSDYNRDKYYDLQSQARDKIEEMNVMNCEDNPGRVRF